MTQIPDFPDYYVTDNGDVWSNKFNKLRKLKPGLNSRGYLQIDLCKDKKPYLKSIHRLIALTLIPNPKNLGDVNHINGIKTDNRIENLEWCTRSQNIQHSFDNGLQKPKIGEEQNHSKLTESQVLEIREKYKTGQYTQKQLGKEYGVYQTLISYIVNNKIWKHI